ncbi:MAG TPA: hexose kinase [Candidatus Limnocylindrales bacterium]|nr:hexose kinase [Candidatus Limnocylindrales bacterium]
MSDRPGRLVVVAANPSIDRLHEVDRLDVGAINRPVRVVPVAGGKGLNLARAAVALGGDVTVVALLGGHAGTWIADRLADAGVGASLVEVAAETRTCVTVVDRSSGQLTEFYEAGEPLEAGAWDRLEAAVVAELDRGGVAGLAMSGSLPPGAPADGYARLVRLAGERSVAAFVDGHGDALAAAIGAGPAVVKVNAAEAGGVTGTPVDTAEDAVRAARTIAARGVGAVIVTLGSEGAVGVASGTAWQFRGADVRGSYPVGSGDAFLAGLAVGLASGRSFIESARLAMAAGAANALAPGAGVLDPAVARTLLDRISVERA